MKKRLFITTYILTILLASTLFGREGHLPDNWLISNEKALKNAEDEKSLGYSLNNQENDVELESHENTSGLQAGMKKIMLGSRRALNKVDNHKGKNWELTTIRWDLAVTMSGLVGLLGLGGSAFSSLRWEPKKNTKVIPTPQPQDEDSTNGIHPISFSSEMSEDEILDELRPAVEAAYASKSVYNKKALSKTLFSKTLELQDLVRGLEGDRPKGNIWWVDKIRLRIDVKASGMIAPATYLGSMVRFRFQWQRIKRKDETKRNFHVASYRESSMTNFVQEMSKDLEEYETLNLKDKKFYLKYIRLRVGLGVKGSVHLAKLEGSVNGAVFFTRDTKAYSDKRDIKKLNSHSINNSSLSLASETDHNEVENDYLDLKEEITPTTIKLAKITNTAVSPEVTSHSSNNTTEESFNSLSTNSNTSNINSNSALFRIKRSKFKRGLRKSAKIAKRMISMLGNADGKDWKLAKAFIGFEVILSGKVGPVTLKGIPSIELRFNRKS